MSDLKPLLIIDGYGFIFRAYHVQPPLTAPDGTPVGAIYGFTSMLLKLINDFKPEDVVIVLDSAGKNFRHNIYNEYKANRPPAPDDLIVQLKLVENAANALNFKCLSKQGFEADDIIATLAKRASKVARPSVIISADKDLMQLVDNHVKMYDPVKSKYITREDVIAKFGVPPLKVRDVQALMGDKSDNIPGVAGIGAKTAAQLINQFGDLGNVLSSIDQVKSPRQQELLKQHKEDALISWQLVGLDDNVAIKQDIHQFNWTPPQCSQISEFLNKNGFKSLSKRVENLFNIKIQDRKTYTTINKTPNQELNNEIVQVKNASQLDLLMKEIEHLGIVAVNIKLTDAEKIEFIIFVKTDIYVIPFNKSPDVAEDLFSYNDSESSSISFNKQLYDLFEDESIKKITYNLKSLLQICSCQVRSFDDIQIMDYILSAGKKSKDISDIIAFYANGKLDENDDININSTQYFYECYRQLLNELVKNKALHLYEQIDLPLCYILHDMEKQGVKIDVEQLVKLSLEFSKKITTLEKKIFAISKKEFNIGSPKQLGEVLFDEMKLPFAKMNTKNSSYSTNVDVLEKLRNDGHAIAELLLEYRHLAKLKSTYTEALAKQVDPITSKIHTTFLQTTTSTGRLSSINPNVQNIPIRSSQGSSIRAAFVASNGHKLISADYSQIELRILSHVANIESLKKAFSENRDIHTQTASQVFGISHDKITPDMRRKAKAINFGIIYGISSFGLARQLNISKQEASNYIEKYFKEYPDIQKYMSESIEFAKDNGFITNLIGRKCFFLTINNKNHTLRALGERAAINAPMQSLAADIVKMTMIALDKEFKIRSMKTKIILQIHDELIFEAPESEVNIASKLIKSIMENIYALDVKMKIDLNVGNNWQKIH